MSTKTLGNSIAMHYDSFSKITNPCWWPNYRRSYQISVSVTTLSSRSQVNTLPDTRLLRRKVSHKVLKVKDMNWNLAQAIGHPVTNRGEDDEEAIRLKRKKKHMKNHMKNKKTQKISRCLNINHLWWSKSKRLNHIKLNVFKLENLS